MAVRWRKLRPDDILWTEQYGEIPVVSDAAFREAVLAAADIVSFAGGGFTLTVSRHPTGIPNEMVTTEALIEWRDRTDAKPQPETAAPLPRVDEADVLQPDPDPTPTELEARLEAEAATTLEPDGFDRSKLEEEDLSEIPAEMR